MTDIKTDDVDNTLSETPISETIVDTNPDLARYIDEPTAAANDENYHDEPSDEQAEPMKKKDAEAAALMMLGASVAGFNAFTPYQVDIENAEAGAFAKGVAPVIAKYSSSDSAPGWFAKYKEELKALGAITILGFSITNQVLMQKRVMAENAANDENQKEKAG